jgi:hypothetical protein
MLAKLGQLECAQGFVLLMYNFLEMLGKFMEFMPLGSAVYGNSHRLLPVRALNPLMRMRVYRGIWTSWDLPRTRRTRYLNPAMRSSAWSPFSD